MPHYINENVCTPCPTPHCVSLAPARRKLSLEAHPDKAGDSPEVLKRFQEISEAYEVLSDEEKRQVYDQHGHEGLKQHGQRGQGGGGGHNPFDIFSSFFGGGGSPFGQQQEPEERRTPDVQIDVQVSLEDVYLGKTLSAAVRNQQLCPKCGGTGARSDADVTKCHSCGGQGMKVTTRQLAPGFVQQFQAPCDVCGGKGKVIKHKCPHCSGHKVVTGDKTLTVRLDPGVPEGHIITLENEADEAPDFNAGHYKFRVLTAPHARFRRSGDDLHLTVRISLAQSLLGGEVVFSHLDKRQIKVPLRGITKPGDVMNMAGEGMPKYGNSARRGNLFITFVVDFPETLTAEQKAGFAKILP